jgi:RNA polymerase sigma-70 factor (ECF subfamily)
MPAETQGLAARPAPAALSAGAPGASGAGTNAPPLERVLAGFEQIYAAHADFVWRSLRRMGVSDHAADDALQDVFLVVHRRFAEYDPDRPIKTWLYGIALRVARDHRRRTKRKGGLEPLGEMVFDTKASQEEAAINAEGLRIVHELLDRLDEDKREVFVLAQLEQLTGAEISEILGVNQRTVYSRLRSARAEFDAAVRRHLRRQR